MAKQQIDNLARTLAPSLSYWLIDRETFRHWGNGSVFPTGTDIPSGLRVGDRYFRTDLLLECVYDGTRWITAHNWTVPILIPNRSPISVNTTWVTRIRNDFDLYVERVDCSTVVQTTNNGSNFWTMVFQGINPTITGSANVWVPTTASDTVGVETDHSGISNQVPSVVPAYVGLNLQKTGAPGNIIVTATFTVRMIIP